MIFVKSFLRNELWIMQRIGYHPFFQLFLSKSHSIPFKKKQNLRCISFLLSASVAKLITSKFDFSSVMIISITLLIIFYSTHSLSFVSILEISIDNWNEEAHHSCFTKQRWINYFIIIFSINLMIFIQYNL